MAQIRLQLLNPAPGASSRHRGFSLTELMVATTLLATATAGGITALSQSHAARRDAGELQQLHERAQYVFATLEPELQMAGYFGGVAAAARLAAASIPEAAQRCGVDVIGRIDLPVQVLPTWSLPCEARGSGAEGGSEVLILRRLSARLAERPERGRAQWLSEADPASAHLYWGGEAPWSASTPAGRELRELLVRIYYVGRAADGDLSTPALRVKSLTSIAGVPTFIDTEVMHGIENLQVEPLPAAAVPRAVRVRLRVRANGARQGTAHLPRTLEITRQFALRNAPG
jgi:prepilin-type N-terminal cleavage/methylation domain-containing protein